MDPWRVVEARPLDLRDGIQLRDDSPALYATANLLWSTLARDCNRTDSCAAKV